MMTSILAQASGPMSATSQLLGLGLPGLAILGLLVALRFLQNRNDSLLEQIGKLNDARLADRDLRLEDQRANAKVILEVTDRYKETINSFKDEVRELKEEVGSLRPPPYR